MDTKPAAPVTGGGTSNTAFLAGGAGGPNAVSVEVSATFWIETVKGSPNFLQLQYSQLVLLNFNGLSWPHITVATLKQNVPVIVPPWKVDPSEQLIAQLRPVRVNPGDPVETSLPWRLEY